MCVCNSNILIVLLQIISGLKLNSRQLTGLKLFSFSYVTIFWIHTRSSHPGVYKNLLQLKLKNSALPLRNRKCVSSIHMTLYFETHNITQQFLGSVTPDKEHQSNDILVDAT